MLFIRPPSMLQSGQANYAPVLDLCDISCRWIHIHIRNSGAPSHGNIIGEERRGEERRGRNVVTRASLAVAERRRKSLKDDAAVMRAGWASEGGPSRASEGPFVRPSVQLRGKRGNTLARSSNEKGNPHERKRGTDHGWNTAMSMRERDCQCCR